MQRFRPKVNEARATVRVYLERLDMEDRFVDKIIEAIDDILEDEIEAYIFKKTTQESPEWCGRTNFRAVLAA